MIKQINHFFCVVFISSLVCGQAFAAPIELGIGARAQGIGGAFVGIADDASAAYWNPAGLGYSKFGEARFMHWIPQNLSDVSIEWVGVSYPLTMSNSQGLGVSWLRKGATLEEGRDNLTTSFAENTYSLSYGVSILNKLVIGATLNRLSVNSDIGGSSGVGFDAGVLYMVKMVRLGFVAKNLSSNMGDENFLPIYRTGFALELQKFTWAFDISTKENINGKNSIALHYFTGMEVRIVPQLAIRVGYNDNNPINAGIGLNIKNVLFEYAFSAIKDGGLTNSHRVELGYRFSSTVVK